MSMLSRDRIFRSLRTFLIALAIIAMVVWILSYVLYWRINIRNPYGTQSLRIASGWGVVAVLFETIDTWPSLPLFTLKGSSDGEWLVSEGGFQGIYADSSFRRGYGGDGRSWHWHVRQPQVKGPLGIPVNTTELLVWFPWWFAVLILGIWPTWSYGFRQRRQSKTCQQCGYDLRGSTESSVCPECGARVSTTPANQTMQQTGQSSGSRSSLG